MRDKIGSFRECADMQSWLQNWIIKYVDGDPAHSTRRDQGASKPLAGAEVIVEPVEGNPGYYHIEVLPAAPLPARRPHRVPQARFEAPVRRKPASRTESSVPTSTNH